MKRLRISITMGDGAPEGAALLMVLGRMVQEVITLVDQKSLVFTEYGFDEEVRVKCKWVPVKPPQTC